MYKKIHFHQTTFYDFNQSCGMELSSENEWCRLGDRIAWNELEETYSQNFPGHTGRPAFSVRMALGALIIQKRMRLSDRALVKAIAENPYYQYFIGLQRFTPKCPFTAPALVSFRKRLTADALVKFNEICLRGQPATPEHRKERTEASENGENVGTMILDATASPSNIRFPQDFSLLNEAREKTDRMIDLLHKQIREKLHPRTYREVLHNAYLNVAKSKKRTAKAVRSLIRKLLCAVKRNLQFVDSYLARGGILPRKDLTNLETIRQLYLQQKEMFDRHTHRVENRIVSISQPYLRPIIRGKAKTPVEFGAKYDVSVDEKGHARLEKISFDAYNECGTLQCASERYLADGTPRIFENYYGEKVKYEIRDAVGGMDVSGSMPQRDLIALMGNLEKDSVERQKLEMIGNRLQDYVDGDDLLKLHGMERNEYLQANLINLPRNRPFQYREEMLLIPGIRDICQPDDSGRLSSIRLIAPKGLQPIGGRPNLYSSSVSQIANRCRLTDMETAELEQAFAEWYKSRTPLKKSLPPGFLKRLEMYYGTSESGFYTVLIDTSSEQPGVRLAVTFRSQFGNSSQLEFYEYMYK